MKWLNGLKGRYKSYKLQKSFPMLRQAFQVSSHLTLEEKIQLYMLAKDRNTILEIGSYIGASACCFGAAMKSRARGKIYCVDTWQNDAMTEGNRDTWQEFLKNTKFYEEHIIPIRGFSSDVAEDVALRAGSLDLLFIDGDHSYEGVKADWDCYKKLLNPESVIVFHDWGWAEGVKRVINEDVGTLVSGHASLPNMWWGTLRARP